MGGEISSLVKRAKANDEELGQIDLSQESSPLNEDAIKAVAQSLASNTHVRHVDFSGHPAAGGKGGGKHIGAMLAANRTGLSVVKLARTAQGDAGAEAIAQGLETAAKEAGATPLALTTLDLRSCAIGGAGVRALAAAVSLHPSLSELRLDDNALGVKEAVPALADMLRKGAKALRVIGLSGCGINAAQAATLAQALTEREANGLPALTVLDLGSNALGDDGAAALTPLLSSACSPARVILSSNGLSNAAGAALLSTFRKADALQALDVTGNKELTGAVLSDIHDLFLEKAKLAREKRAKAAGDNDD
jgi:Ran GTPase-activating protein (RanGAP) involved in mRNA processing and transport